MPCRCAAAGCVLPFLTLSSSHSPLIVILCLATSTWSVPPALFYHLVSYTSPSLPPGQFHQPFPTTWSVSRALPSCLPGQFRRPFPTCLPGQLHLVSSTRPSLPPGLFHRPFPTCLPVTRSAQQAIPYLFTWSASNPFPTCLPGQLASPSLPVYLVS